MICGLPTCHTKLAAVAQHDFVASSSAVLSEGSGLTCIAPPGPFGVTEGGCSDSRDVLRDINSAYFQTGRTPTRHGRCRAYLNTTRHFSASKSSRKSGSSHRSQGLKS